MECTEPGCGLADQVAAFRDAFRRGSEEDIDRDLARLVRMTQEYVEHVMYPGGAVAMGREGTLDNLIGSSIAIYESIRSLSDEIRNDRKVIATERLDEMSRHVNLATHHLMVAKASVLNNERRYAESEECLAVALDIEVTPEAANELGVALTGMGRYYEAESCLETATLLRPEYHAAEFNKAVLNDDTGNHGLAADGFDFLLNYVDLDRFGCWCGRAWRWRMTGSTRTRCAALTRRPACGPIARTSSTTRPTLCTG